MQSIIHWVFSWIDAFIALPIDLVCLIRLKLEAKNRNFPLSLLTFWALQKCFWQAWSTILKWALVFCTLLKNSSFCANERNKSHTWSHFMCLCLTITKILIFQMFSSVPFVVLLIMLKHNFTNCFHGEGLLITTLLRPLDIDYVTKVKILFGCLSVSSLQNMILQTIWSIFEKFNILSFLFKS